MSPVLTRHKPQPVRNLRRGAGLVVMGVVTVGLFALLLDLVAPPATVDRLTITSRAATQVEVGVTAHGAPGALWIATVEPGATAVVEDVLDHDGDWVVRGEHAGRSLGELRLPREELARRGWRVTIPAGWGERVVDGP